MKSELKKSLKIILAIVGLITSLVVIAVLLFPFWAKNKLVVYFDEHTEYTLHLESVFIGMNSAEISFMEITPKLDKEASQKNYRFQKDWIASKVERLKIQGIDWIGILFHEKANIDKVSIINPQIYVYRNKSLPDSHAYQALPSTLLRSLKYSFSISSIEIVDGLVEYEERPDKGSAIAAIQFNSMHASILHLSSDSMYTLINPILLMEAKAISVDSIKMQIECKANMLSTKDEFTLKGSIGAFNPTVLNKYLAPLANVKIKEGYVDSVHFIVEADENIATGKLDMNYRDLKIAVLSKEPHDGKIKIKSILANLFVQNEDKPSKKPSGAIHFKRRKDRFIFNYWWNALKSGMISTISTMPIDPNNFRTK